MAKWARGVVRGRLLRRGQREQQQREDELDFGHEGLRGCGSGAREQSLWQGPQVASGDKGTMTLSQEQGRTGSVTRLGS